MRLMFAGDGWGAVAALKSLQRDFTALDVRSEDAAVLRLLRAEDRPIKEFGDSNAKFAICAGYKKIITKQELAQHTFINIHYSLLPLYRGMHSTVWAILNGEKKLGLSIHLMNEYIDDGDLLAQYVVLYRGQTAKEIMEKCNSIVESKLGGVIGKYIKGKLTPTKQRKDKATWVPKRNINDCRVDFEASCLKLARTFKALVAPYPLPHLNIAGEIYEITQASLHKKNYQCTNGRIVNTDNEGAWIKISDGLLLVKELTKDGHTVDPLTVLKIGQRL